MSHFLLVCAIFSFGYGLPLNKLHDGHAADDILLGERGDSGGYACPRGSKAITDFETCEAVAVTKGWLATETIESGGQPEGCFLYELYGEKKSKFNTGELTTNGDRRSKLVCVKNIDGECGSDNDCSVDYYCKKSTNKCTALTPINGDCASDTECGAEHYCNSKKKCVRYSGSYCKKNECGVGDGDCDPDDGQCASGLRCGSDNCQLFHSLKHIDNKKADCCWEADPAIYLTELESPLKVALGEKFIVKGKSKGILNKRVTINFNGVCHKIRCGGSPPVGLTLSFNEAFTPTSVGNFSVSVSSDDEDCDKVDEYDGDGCADDATTLVTFPAIEVIGAQCSSVRQTPYVAQLAYKEGMNADSGCSSEETCLQECYACDAGETLLGSGRCCPSSRMTSEGICCDEDVVDGVCETSCKKWNDQGLIVCADGEEPILTVDAREPGLCCPTDNKEDEDESIYLSGHGDLKYKNYDSDGNEIPLDD